MIQPDIFNQFYFFLAAAAAEGEEVGLAERFGLDWMGFLGQLFVFVVVYFILSKFAFGPITDVLRQRRKKIEESVENAERIKKQLAESEVRYKQTLDEAHVEASRLIKEARESSESLRERRTQEAIKEAESIISKAREATEREHQQMYTQLRQELGDLVVQTTSMVTSKVLDEEDKRKLNEAITSQLSADGGSSKN